jgi:hypothetical protein
MPIHNEDGAGGPHAYVPWTMHAQNRNGELGFPGGYHLEFTSGRQMPSLSMLNGIDSRSRVAVVSCMAASSRRRRGASTARARLWCAGHDAAE